MYHFIRFVSCNIFCFSIRFKLQLGLGYFLDWSIHNAYQTALEISEYIKRVLHKADQVVKLPSFLFSFTAGEMCRILVEE